MVAAAAAATEVPLLMLAEKEENAEIREFFDLSSGLTHSMNLPELAGKCYLGVGYPGWLFTADEQGNMNLFHIFSRTVINLPHMSMLEDYDELCCIDTGYVEKAVISADPLYSTDYVLALIQGSPPTFAFWRPGDTSFTSLGTTIRDCAYADITWHDGKFYGHNFVGEIVIFGFQDAATARVVRGIPPDLTRCCQVYLVYSRGELLVITRDGVISDEGQDTDQYGVKTFHVYKINDVNSTSYGYEEVENLDNRALFVGRSATLAVEEDQAIGCKRNHIYFTDDCLDSYFGLEQGGGKDMGVYNLLDGTIAPHYTGQSYHKVTPPLWV